MSITNLLADYLPTIHSHRSRNSSSDSSNSNSDSSSEDEQIEDDIAAYDAFLLNHGRQQPATPVSSKPSPSQSFTDLAASTTTTTAAATTTTNTSGLVDNTSAGSNDSVVGVNNGNANGVGINNGNANVILNNSVGNNIGNTTNNTKNTIPIQTTSKARPSKQAAAVVEEEEEEEDEYSSDEEDQNKPDEIFLQIGSMTLTKNQAKLYGLQLKKTKNPTAKPQKFVTSSIPGRKHKNKKGLSFDSLDRISQPVMPYVSAPEATSYGKTDDIINCTFKPSKSKAAIKAMNDKACAYDFLSSNIEKAEFIKRMDAFESYRLKKYLKNKGEQSYDCSLDKKICLECRQVQSYDEMISKRSNCTSERCSDAKRNSVYVREHNFLLHRWMGRMEKSSIKKQKILEGVMEGEKLKGLRAKKTAYQQVLIDKVDLERKQKAVIDGMDKGGKKNDIDGIVEEKKNEEKKDERINTSEVKQKRESDDSTKKAEYKGPSSSVSSRVRADKLVEEDKQEKPKPKTKRKSIRKKKKVVNTTDDEEVEENENENVIEEIQIENKFSETRISSKLNVSNLPRTGSKKLIKTTSNVTGSEEVDEHEEKIMRNKFETALL